MKTPFRTIPDTNVVIAAQNANPNSPNAEYFERWLRQEFVVLYCEDTLKEYIKKLVEKQIPTQLIKSLIIAILELGERVDIEFFHCPVYPIDVDDIPFLLCAVNGKASHVISYDAHLHALNGRYSFIVYKPLEFLFELRAAA